jgi:hypothetical protein
MVQCLPILIHIALFLFCTGLVILVIQDDIIIGVAILVLTAVTVLLYVGSTIHPTYSPDSPFRTPLSGIIPGLLTGTWGREEYCVFPNQPDTQKAQALTSLLMESTNVDTINAAIYAIAGLPTSPAVQDELLRSSIVSLLSRTLCTGLADDDRDAIRSSLYALLRLVQAAPANARDVDAMEALRALVNPDGPLALTDSLAPGIREIALCVKGRILLHLCRHTPNPTFSPDTTLFEMEIPLLAKSCGDEYLSRLLHEICLLGQASAKPTRCKYPFDFLAILNDPNSPNRNDVHMVLVNAAILGMSQVPSIDQKFINDIQSAASQTASQSLGPKHC